MAPGGYELKEPLKFKGIKILFLVQRATSSRNLMTIGSCVITKRFKIANSVQTRQSYRKADKTFGECTEYNLRTE